MKMHDIEINAVDGEIHIGQKDGEGGVDYVVITPEQAEIVCTWIMQAAVEATKDA